MPRTHFPIAVNQILLRAGKVFLLRRSLDATFFPGMWWLPGGHHDGGETIEQATSRETFEEAGVRVDPADQRVSCIAHTRAGLEAIHFFCVATKFDGEPCNNEPDKAIACGWFDVNNLPSPIPLFVAQAVRDGVAQGKGIAYHPLETDPESKLYG